MFTRLYHLIIVSVGSTPVKNSTLKIVFKCLMFLLFLVGTIGSGMAYSSGQRYLGARLLALSAAALPAFIFSEKYLQAIIETPRKIKIFLVISAFFLLGLLIIALFPQQFFHWLHDLLN